MRAHRAPNSKLYASRLHAHGVCMCHHDILHVTRRNSFNSTNSRIPPIPMVHASHAAGNHAHPWRCVRSTPATDACSIHFQASRSCATVFPRTKKTSVEARADLPESMGPPRPLDQFRPKSGQGCPNWKRIRPTSANVGPTSTKCEPIQCRPTHTPRPVVLRRDGLQSFYFSPHPRFS